MSLLEAILGSFVVIGDDVWRVLPNSVALLCAMALISFRLREGNWSASGLRLPKDWTRTILVAMVAVVVQQAVDQWVVDPLARPYLRYAAAANPMEGLHGAMGLLRWLGIVWTYAAFGEELGYRGYLLNRIADLGDHSVRTGTRGRRASLFLTYAGFAG
ncbi:MAG: hypothetical protein WBW93_08800 [Steroidobacteraceae bacterium]